MLRTPPAVCLNGRDKKTLPNKPAGVTDAFRKMDHKNFSIPADAMKELQAKRKAYQEALRDWVEKGPASRFAFDTAEVLKRMHTPDDAQVRAAANFRLGEYLFEKGHAEAAQKYFEEAKRLRPESWNYKRQAWALEDPMKAGGPEFCAAVDSLGARKYYPVPEDI